MIKINEKSIIYWTFDDIKNNFNIKLNERIMITILINIMLIMMSLWTFKKWLMNFITSISRLKL